MNSSLNLLVRPATVASVVRRSYASSSSVSSVANPQGTPKAIINSVHGAPTTGRRGASAICDKIAKREASMNSHSNNHNQPPLPASKRSGVMFHVKNYLTQTEKALGKITYY